MKKAKLLTVLGVMLAMGITGCNGGKSSAAPESKPGSGAQPVSSTPAPTTSSKAPTSSVAPTPAAEVPDPEGHKWNTDTDVAADATAGTVAYKKATCKDNDGAVRLKVNQSVVTYDGTSTRKDGTPDGYTKLTSNGQTFSFKFKSDKKYMGKLYLYGCMDGWGSSSNHSAGFYYQNQPNVEIKLNGEVIDVSGSKSGSYATWFGEDASEEDSSLSKEGYAPYGSVVINEGVNEFVYKRVQTLNMLIKDFVFIVTEFSEWSAPKAVAADATAGTVGYNLYTNNLNGTKKIEVQLADSMLAEGSENKNDPAGYFKLKSNDQSFSFKFKYDSIAYGELYQRGVMDGWTSNNGRYLFSGGSNGADDFELKINNNKVALDQDQKKLTYKEVMLGDADTEKNLSPLTDVLTADVQLANGVNEFVYTRKASYNLALTHIVFIVKDSDHEHAAGDNAAWVKDEQHHWHICGHEGCNEVIDETAHTWVADESKPDEPATTCDTLGKHYEKCSVCGQTRVVDIPSTIAHTWTEKTAVKNADGKDVIPLECSACHKVGAKMSVNDYADGAQFDSDNDKTADSIRPKQNTAITYKIVVSKAGTYNLEIGLKCKSNGGVAMSSRGFKVSVNNETATVTLDGTKTPDALGLNANNPASIELCSAITLKEGENTIAITIASYRLHYGGNVQVGEK